MTTTRFAVSIVIEWYNMTHAELSRAARMLSGLKSQACSLYSDVADPVRLAQPLELIIVFDSEHFEDEHVRKFIDGAVGNCEFLTIRYLPVPGADYCKQKNAGAAIATGEILIFLDSDLIPESEWLVAFLGAFKNANVSVVVGNTFVDWSRRDLYSKSIALSWMFPLRDPDAELTIAKTFYANNVAIRTKTFLSRQFPDVPGLTHVPAKLLVERLERDGVTLWYGRNARASHHPPSGGLHFVNRAISGGRARALSAESVTLSLVFRWVLNDIKSALLVFKRFILEGFKVELQWWQLPVATSIALTYSTFFMFGSLLSVVAPNFVKDRFKL